MFDDSKDIIYFATVVFAVFVITYLALFFLGLLPSSLGGPDRYIDLEEEFADDKYWIGDTSLVSINSDKYTRPDSISIPKIDVDIQVTHPETRDVETLDRYLNLGAVHYPGSGSVENGNMFIFGHSAERFFTQSRAQRAFDGVRNLIEDDEIYIEADGNTYLYRVTSVSLVNEDNALVTFDNTSRRLTISTCDTFGSVQDRWVVDAVFERII